MATVTSSPLTNHPLYEGHDVDDARQVLSPMFSTVSIEPLSTTTPFSATVNGLELPRTSLCYCEYEHGMVAATAQPLGYHAIQLSRSGTARFDMHNDSIDGDPRKGVMLSAGRPIKVHHSQGNGVLSFIVKDAVIRDVVSAWTGHSRIPRIRFLPQFDPSDPRTASLLSLLRTFADEIDRPGGALESPVVVASFEHTLINFILFGLEHNLSETLRTTPSGAGAEQVKQVEEYIEAHAAQPIDMNTLARVTGHSTSSIFRAFRKHRNYTPLQFLREVRMRLVRQRLLLAVPDSSVTGIAIECGFTHLGRFAAEYRRQFGESPSQTLRRAKRRLSA